MSRALMSVRPTGPRAGDLPDLSINRGGRCVPAARYSAQPIRCNREDYAESNGSAITAIG
jgi:hypothetical protein